jgi:hypothetical protein
VLLGDLVTDVVAQVVIGLQQCIAVDQFRQFQQRLVEVCLRGGAVDEIQQLEVAVQVAGRARVGNGKRIALGHQRVGKCLVFTQRQAASVDGGPAVVAIPRIAGSVLGRTVAGRVGIADLIDQRTVVPEHGRLVQQATLVR